MLAGVVVPTVIGIGDAVQFTSVPENYFRHTGQKIVDTENHWIFDYNPYVVRDQKADPARTYKLWNYDYAQPRPRPSVYLSQAERHAAICGIPTVLIRPRLYIYEDCPIEKRELVLLHTTGKSHGSMPQHVIDHVLKKYKNMNLIQIGKPNENKIGTIPFYACSNIWELVRLIAHCRIFIGMDSGPSWIAACYPDVIIKKLRMKPSVDVLKTWVPLSVDNIHSHWDDRCAQIHNPSEDDVGFTQSYRKI